jgi:thiamine-monophosphate kinase
VGEFDLIRDYFRGVGAQRDDVLVGVGDDGAVLQSPASQNLVSVMDTLVESIHFPVNSPARSVGHRSLAVNLSDIAAMGAEPAWASLSLSMPHLDHGWLADFAAGFTECAKAHGVRLVGGDTVSGPLVVTVHVTGLVDVNSYTLRSGARPGDLIYVTGTLGDAAAGLRAMTRGDGHSFLIERFLYPEPRVTVGIRTRKLVSAAIDISDGLGQDLGHLLRASEVGAKVALEKLPMSSVLRNGFSPEEARYLALCGGDDYELCVTVPSDNAEEFENVCNSCAVRCQSIGIIDDTSGLNFTLDGKPRAVNVHGHDHFAIEN